MPIIKSAIRRVKTAATRAKRNQVTRNSYKEAIKQFSKLVEEGKQKEALALLPAAQKAIDMAAKKGIIHPNNAGRKKSSLAKMVAGESAPKTETKKAAPKKAAAKKTATKKPATKKAAPKKDDK